MIKNIAIVNIGYATPRCILPFGVRAQMDTEKQVIRFGEHSYGG